MLTAVAALLLATGPSPAIAGLVVDASGKPVAGAKVFAMLKNDDFHSGVLATSGDAVTDASGRFRFECPFPCHASLKVEAKTAAAQWVEARAGVETKVVLQRGYRLEGTVVDAAGAPVRTSKLELRGAGMVLNAHSGSAAGHFSQDGLAAGPWEITVEAGCCRTKTVHLTLPSKPQVLRLVPKAVQGVVAGSGDGGSRTVIDLEIPSDDDSFAEAVSDEDGRFGIEPPKPGTYRVMFKRDWQVGRTILNFTGKPQSINLSFPAGVSITGQMVTPDGGAMAGLPIAFRPFGTFRVEDRSAALTEAGLPGMAALMAMVGDDEYYETVTDRAGRFVLPHLPEGKWQLRPLDENVTATGNEHPPRAVIDPRGWPVLDAGTQEFVWTVVPLPRVRGRVIAPDGGPITAEVNGVWFDGGVFDLPADPDSHTALAAFSDDDNLGWAFTSLARPAHDIDAGTLVLALRREVQVKVIDEPSGRPVGGELLFVADAPAVASDPGWKPRHGVAINQSTNDGHWNTTLKLDPARVFVASATHQTASVELPRGPGVVTVALKPGHRITGEIIGADDVTEVAAARREPAAPWPHEAAPHRTNVLRGHFFLDGLTPGKWVLTAKHPHVAPVEVDVNTPEVHARLSARSPAPTLEVTLDSGHPGLHGLWLLPGATAPPKVLTERELEQLTALAWPGAEHASRKFTFERVPPGPHVLLVEIREGRDVLMYASPLVAGSSAASLTVSVPDRLPVLEQ